MQFAFVAERLWLDFVNTEHRCARGHRSAARLGRSRALASEGRAPARCRADQRHAAAASEQPPAARWRCSATPDACEPCSAHSPSVAFRQGERPEAALWRSNSRARPQRRHASGRAAPRWQPLSAPSVPVGDAFAGLLIPVVESAADALILGELSRVRRCADPRCRCGCSRTKKNGHGRWCDVEHAGTARRRHDTG